MVFKRKNENEKLQEELLLIWESLSFDRKEIAVELLKRLRDTEWDD